MRNLVLVPCLFALASCGDGTGNVSRNVEVSVVRLGQQSIEDRNVYSSLGEISFNASQKYRISVNNDPKTPQILFMNITQYAGDVVEQETAPIFIPLKDGKFEFECSKYVSIKSSEEGDWGPIRCEFEPLSIFTSDATASLSKSSTEPSGKK